MRTPGPNSCGLCRELAKDAKYAKRCREHNREHAREQRARKRARLAQAGLQGLVKRRLK